MGCINEVFLSKVLLSKVLFTHTQTHRQQQATLQCIDVTIRSNIIVYMWKGGARDKTTNPVINGQPTILAIFTLSK